MLKKPKKMELNSRQVKQDVLTAYRRITWKIWVYLKANPEVLAANHNKVWGAMMFLELFFYSGMPESYSKTVHQMVLDEEEAERNLAQANT